ncbi:DUF6507 family protein [Nesterenkonia suensis]
MARWDIQVASSREAISGARAEIQSLDDQDPNLYARITAAVEAAHSAEITAALEQVYQDKLSPLLSDAESTALNACDRTDEVIEHHIDGDDQQRQEAEDAATKAENVKGF